MLISLLSIGALAAFAAAVADRDNRDTPAPSEPRLTEKTGTQENAPVAGKDGSDLADAPGGNDADDGNAGTVTLMGDNGDDTRSAPADDDRPDGRLGFDFLADFPDTDSLSGHPGDGTPDRSDGAAAPVFDILDGGTDGNAPLIDDGEIAMGGEDADRSPADPRMTEDQGIVEPIDESEPVTVSDFNPAEEMLNIGVYGPVDGGYSLTAVPEGTAISVGGQIQAILLGVAPAQIAPDAIQLEDIRAVA